MDQFKKAFEPKHAFTVGNHDIGSVEYLAKFVQKAFSKNLEYRLLQDVKVREKILKDGHFISFTDGIRPCKGCGMRFDIIFTINGAVIAPRADALVDCENPEPRDFTVTLNVPSGKILFAEHFNREFDLWSMPSFKDIEFTREFSLESRQGGENTARAYSILNYIELNDNGLGVDIVREGNDIKVINFNEDLDEELGTGNLATRYKAMEKLGYLDRDFWGYGAADYDEVIARGCKLDELDSYVVVNVDAGVYGFTHHYEHLRVNREPISLDIHTTIKKVDSVH